MPLCPSGLLLAAIARPGMVARTFVVAEPVILIVLLEGVTISGVGRLPGADWRHARLLLGVLALDDALGVLVSLVLRHG